MNVLLLRGTPSPKRIRGTFLRHEPTRRTSFYAAIRGHPHYASRTTVSHIAGSPAQPLV
jgi:hypothetical protein